MTKFLVMNKHQSDIYHDEIGLCAQNVDIIIGPQVNIVVEKVYVHDHFEGKRVLILTFYNFGTLTSILKPEINIFVIHGMVTVLNTCQ
jgi:hypothetical protein